MKLPHSSFVNRRWFRFIGVFVAAPLSVLVNANVLAQSIPLANLPVITPVTASKTFTGAASFTDLEMGWDSNPGAAGYQAFGEGYHVGEVGALPADAVITFNGVAATLNANGYSLGNNFGFVPNTAFLSQDGDAVAASSGGLTINVNGGTWSRGRSPAGLEYLSSSQYFNETDSGGTISTSRYRGVAAWLALTGNVPGKPLNLNITGTTFIETSSDADKRFRLLANPLKPVGDVASTVAANLTFPPGQSSNIVLTNVSGSLSQIGNVFASAPSTFVMKGGSDITTTGSGTSTGLFRSLELGCGASVDGSTTGGWTVALGDSADVAFTYLRSNPLLAHSDRCIGIYRRQPDGYVGPPASSSVTLQKAVIERLDGNYAVEISEHENASFTLAGNSEIRTVRAADAVAILDGLAGSVANINIESGIIQANLAGGEPTGISRGIVSDDNGSTNFAMTGGLISLGSNANTSVDHNIGVDIRNHKGASGLVDFQMSGGTIASAGRAIYIDTNDGDVSCEISGSALISGRSSTSSSMAGDIVRLNGALGLTSFVMNGGVIERPAGVTGGASFSYLVHFSNNNQVVAEFLNGRISTDLTAASPAGSTGIYVDARSTRNNSPKGASLTFGDGVSPNNAFLLSAGRALNSSANMAVGTIMGPVSVVLRQGATIEVKKTADSVAWVYVDNTSGTPPDPVDDTFVMEGGEVTAIGVGVDPRVQTSFGDDVVRLLGGSHVINQISLGDGIDLLELASTTSNVSIFQTGIVGVTTLANGGTGIDTLRLTGNGWVLAEAVTDAAGRFQNFDCLELAAGATMSVNQTFAADNNRMLLSLNTPGAYSGVLTGGSGQFINAGAGTDVLAVEYVTDLDLTDFGTTSGKFRNFEVVQLGVGSIWTGSRNLSGSTLTQIIFSGGTTDSPGGWTLGNTTNDVVTIDQTAFSSPGINAQGGVDTLVFTSASGNVADGVNGASTAYTGFETVIFRGGDLNLLDGLATNTYSGIISNNGGTAVSILKDQDGEWRISSANVHSGPTMIGRGRLLITNTTGSALGSGDVTVAAGAAFGGTGATTGTVTLSGGISSSRAVLLPGLGVAPVGLQDLVTGSVVMGTESELRMRVASPGNHTKLVCQSISVDVAARIVVELDSYVPVPGDSFQLIASTSPLPAGIAARLVLPTNVVWDTSTFESDGTLRVPAQAPTIVAHPQALQRLGLGATASFNVQAIGSGLSYQWQFRPNVGSSWVNATGMGATTANLIQQISSTSAYGQYRVIVSGTQGMPATSSVAELDVISYPLITSQPMSAVKAIGQPHTFNVTATTDDPVTYPITYQWQFRNSSASSWGNVSGATSTSLVVTAAEAAYGYYRCQAINTNGVAISAVATLLPPVPPSYATWATSQGLTPSVNDGIDDDPDSDGIVNLLEFALNSDPLHGAQPGTSRVEQILLATDRYLQITLPVQDGTSFTGTPLTGSANGITYRITADGTLIGPGALGVVEVAPPSSTMLPVLSPGWSYRTFRLSQPNLPAAFMKATVTTP